MTRVNVPIEMNEDLYDKMQELCEELGLDVDTAIGIFAQKMVNEEGMPFEVTEKDLPVDEEAELRAKRLKTAGIIGAIAALIGLVTGILLAVRSLKEHRR